MTAADLALHIADLLDGNTHEITGQHVTAVASGTTIRVRLAAHAGVPARTFHIDITEEV